MWTSETRKRVDRLISEMNAVVDSGNQNFKKIKTQIEDLQKIKKSVEGYEERIQNLEDQVASLDSMMEQILNKLDGVVDANG